MPSTIRSWRPEQPINRRGVEAGSESEYQGDPGFCGWERSSENDTMALERGRTPRRAVHRFSWAGEWSPGDNDRQIAGDTCDRVADHGCDVAETGPLDDNAVDMPPRPARYPLPSRRFQNGSRGLRAADPVWQDQATRPARRAVRQACHAVGDEAVETRCV